MNKQDDNAPQTDAPKSMTDWMAEISAGLLWMSKRWAVLGSISVLLPMLSIFFYATIWHVPMNIFSTMIITELPMVLAVEAMAVFIIGANLVMPSMALLMPVWKGGPALFDTMTDCKRNNNLPERNNKDFSMRICSSIGVAWIVELVAVMAALLFIFNWLPETCQLFTGLSVLVIHITCILFIAKKFVKREHHQASLKNASTDFWMIMIFMGIAQFLLLCNCLQIVLWIVGRTSWAVFYALLATVIVGILQLVTAKIYVHIKSQKYSLRHITAMIAVAIMLVILTPPIGGFLAGYALQSLASGGRGCIVLEWMPSSMPAQDRSAPLRILLVEDNRYQVRFLSEKEDAVHFVDRSQVAGIKACSQSSEANTNTTVPTGHENK